MKGASPGWRFWCMELFSRRFWLGCGAAALLCAGFALAGWLDWWKLWPGGGTGLAQVGLCLVLAGAVLPPVLGSGMFAGGRARSQVALVLSKPVSRARYFWLKLAAAAAGYLCLHLLVGLVAWWLSGKGIQQVDRQFWMILLPTLLWGWCGVSATGLLSSLLRSALACGALSCSLLLGVFLLLYAVPPEGATRFLARELSCAVLGPVALALGGLNVLLLLAGRRVFERADL